MWNSRLLRHCYQTECMHMWCNVYLANWCEKCLHRNMQNLLGDANLMQSLQQMSDTLQHSEPFKPDMTTQDLRKQLMDRRHEHYAQPDLGQPPEPQAQDTSIHMDTDVRLLYAFFSWLVNGIICFTLPLILQCHNMCRWLKIILWFESYIKDLIFFSISLSTRPVN